jgi:hypothetical protein
MTSTNTVLLFLVFIVVTLLTSTTNGDLPLHCVHQQIHGQWMIFTSSFNHTAKTPLHCEKQDRKLFDVQDVHVVQLKYPNQVIVEKKVVGTWTMVYDQGFEFTIGEKKVCFVCLLYPGMSFVC